MAPAARCWRAHICVCRCRDVGERILLAVIALIAHLHSLLGPSPRAIALSTRRYTNDMAAHGSQRQPTEDLYNLGMSAT